MRIFFSAIVGMVLVTGQWAYGSCNSHSIYVPRQLSYNPIYENALMMEQTRNMSCGDYIFSLKPLYTQSTGCVFQRYFNPYYLSSLVVREDGSGNVDSLWFKVISSDTTFYRSTLSFNPERRTYGGLLYFNAKLSRSVQLSINTAIVYATSTMNICETDIENRGTVPGIETITQSFAHQSREFGRISGKKAKAGVDDIQIKLIKSLCTDICEHWDVYALFGLPTGAGSKSRYLFEPLVGSKHPQIGFGSTYARDVYNYSCGKLVLAGEFKWRYGCFANETRLFDIDDNGQWSRYLLLVNQLDPSTTFFAGNALALPARVSPRNSIDLFLSAHALVESWRFEIGYDFWYRSSEKIGLNSCAHFDNTVGIADLVGIAATDPHTSSSANITQGVEPGINQAVSDATFIPLRLNQLSLRSGAQPQNISNSVYGSIGYTFDSSCYAITLGLNGSYEVGHGRNTPDNASFWINFDVEF